MHIALKDLLTVFQKQSPGDVLIRGALKNFAKFTDQHLCRSLFSNKVAELRSSENLFYKSRGGCFLLSAKHCISSISTFCVSLILYYNGNGMGSSAIFLNMIKNQSPQYLFNAISTIRESIWNNRHLHYSLVIKRIFLQKFFLPVHSN